MLYLFDLDGTLTDIDAVDSLVSAKRDEVYTYFEAAASFVATQTGLDADEVFLGLKKEMLNNIFPCREKYVNWASFSSTDATSMKVAPAVDHHLLVPPSVVGFLKDKIGNVEGDVQAKIQAILDSSNWEYSLYSHSSNQSLPYSALSDDACIVIEKMLRDESLFTVFTNSSTEKAATLLKRAGFEDKIVYDSVAPGKVGIVGRAAKFQIDTAVQPDLQSTIDLTPYYGEHILLDLRRKRFHDMVVKLLHLCEGQDVAMITDIPEIDSLPFKWFGQFPDFSSRKVFHGIKTNPTSVQASIDAACDILGAKSSNKLSDLVASL